MLSASSAELNGTKTLHEIQPADDFPLALFVPEGGEIVSTTLIWPGKQECLRAAEQPTNKRLSPVPESSVDWHRTRNIYIEGDNLDALKVLRTTHEGRIKCIYIDPPYNTGKSFVYKDGFSVHSEWLNMMYPRLILARSLLKDDGAILISIDDNELHHLRLICDDIFGSENHVLTVVVNRASEIASNNTISKHEYMLIYCKDRERFKVNGVQKYTLSRGTVGNLNQTMPVIEFPPGLRCEGISDGVYYKTRHVPGSRENIENLNPLVVKDGKLAESARLRARWRSSNDMRRFFANNCNPTRAKISGVIEEIFFRGDRFVPYIKKLTYEKIPSLYLENKRGSADLEKLGMAEWFPFPKSVSFLKRYLSYLDIADGEFVLDFFSGSASTAQAVMELNAEDGGKRKFIMIQLPEKLGADSSAYQAGCRNICHIGQERIRRAADKIKRETGVEIDYGFRVYRTADDER